MFYQQPQSSNLLSWTEIVDEFGSLFDEKCSKKKSHFDSGSKVIDIDGGTSKWSQALLLDAVVCFHKNRTHFTTRRGFDQHIQLKRAVEIVVERNAAFIVPANGELLWDVREPWDSFDSFRQHFTSLYRHMKECTKEKVVKICQATCDEFQDTSLESILNSVVRRLLLSSNFYQRLMQDRKASSTNTDFSLQAVPALPGFQTSEVDMNPTEEFHHANWGKF